MSLWPLYDEWDLPEISALYTFLYRLDLFSAKSFVENEPTVAVQGDKPLI